MMSAGRVRLPVGSDRQAPELIWPGKAGPVVPRDASLATIEVVGAERAAGRPGQGTEGWRNRLIHGDNLRAMAALLPVYAGEIQLVYVDPPFDTGAAYMQRIAVADAGGRRPPRVLPVPAYRDSWGPGRGSYLQMLYERLHLAHALLAEGGAIYVHVDPTVSPYVRLLLDEIFGPAGFQREIVWRIGWVSGYKSAAANWVRNHDTILYYTKGRPAVFNKEYLAYPVGYRRRGSGRRGGRGYPIEDVWNATPAEQALAGADSLDSIQIKSFSTEKTGFPTQKNESLLRRIVRASSRPGDLVADFFCGSGTTLVVAEQLGRRWIGCDCEGRAVHTARKRLVGTPGVAPFLVQGCTDCRGADWRLAAGAHRKVAACPEITVKTMQRRVSVRLRGYRPAHGSGERRARGTEGTAYVDYWAVDYEHDGEVFRDAWRSFRGRAADALELEAPAYTYARGGAYRIAVKVVDIFGGEATPGVGTVVA